MIALLNIFGQHLSSLSNQLLVLQQNAEPPMIARAKDYIDKNLAQSEFARERRSNCRQRMI